MRLLIKQPAGLGDVFFCQKIAAQVGLRYDQPIIWPILDHFLYIKDYLRPTLATEYVSVDGVFPYQVEYDHASAVKTSYAGADIINLHGHVDDRGTVMKPKYDVLGLDWSNWSDYFHFERNFEREQKLWNHLGLLRDEQYIFINRAYASPPGVLRVGTVNPEPKLKIVEMQLIDGFNLFDWCSVIENATEIHTVETSVCYLIEKMNTTKKLFMYARGKKPDWFYIDGIFQKPWMYEQ